MCCALRRCDGGSEDRPKSLAQNNTFRWCVIIGERFGKAPHEVATWPVLEVDALIELHQIEAEEREKAREEAKIEAEKARKRAEAEAKAKSRAGHRG